MLGASVETSATSDLSDRVDRGVKRAMRDASDAGFAVSQDEVPDGATSTLRMSAFEPTWAGNTLVWGYRADYARNVEEGTDAHYPPIEPLKLWASRVLGDEKAAYAVQETIGQEGTEPHPYVEPGYEAMVDHLREHGFADYIDAER